MNDAGRATSTTMPGNVDAEYPVTPLSASESVFLGLQRCGPLKQ